MGVGEDGTVSGRGGKDDGSADEPDGTSAEVERILALPPGERSAAIAALMRLDAGGSAPAGPAAVLVPVGPDLSGLSGVGWGREARRAVQGLAAESVRLGRLAALSGRVAVLRSRFMVVRGGRRVAYVHGRVRLALVVWQERRRESAYNRACDAAMAGRVGIRSSSGQRYARPLALPGRLLTGGEAAILNPDRYEPGLTKSGPAVFVEQRSGVVLRMDHWYGYGTVTRAPNVLVVGKQGYGKSLFLKRWATDEVTHPDRFLVVIDAKPTSGGAGEWAVYGRKYGWTTVTFGDGVTRINVLDPGIALGSATSSGATQSGLVRVIAETVMGRPLLPVEKEALRSALIQVRRNYDRASEAGENPVQPVLSDLVEALLGPSQAAADEVKWSVEKLQAAGQDVALELRDLLAGPVGATINGQTSLGVDLKARAIVFDLSQLSADRLSVPVVMTVVNAFIQNEWATPGPKRIIMIDEATAVLRVLPLARALEASQKVSRGKGIAHWVSVQQIANVTGARTDPDLEAAVLSVVTEAETVVAFRQDPDQAAALARVRRLPDIAVERLSTMPSGECVVCISDRPPMHCRVSASGLQVSEMQSDDAMKVPDVDAVPEWAGIA